MKLKTCVFLMAIFVYSMANAQNSVHIRGHVQFIDEGFKVSVYRYVGTDKMVLAETMVDAESHNYSVNVPVSEIGEAIVDCGQWQTVNVWLENENLDIDFRGKDTARIKIKNPPYVYIRGGKNNELMNLINYQSYRNYQQMIAISQNVYKAKFSEEKDKQALSMALYNANEETSDAYNRFFVEYYADRNSVLVPLERLSESKDKALIDATLTTLAKQSEESAQLVARYKAKKEDEKFRKERCAVGAVAPDFVSLTEKGKKVRLSDLKGKIVVVDFWASWCGPCRAEIPNMKKIYADIDHKKVEFLSVSIDAKRDAWIKAVKEENMPWKLTWTPDAGKEVMDLYQFNGIPFIIIIDKEGKIFKKHLRGNAIQDAINEALK